MSSKPDMVLRNGKFYWDFRYPSSLQITTNNVTHSRLEGKYVGPQTQDNDDYIRTLRYVIRSQGLNGQVVNYDVRQYILSEADSPSYIDTVVSTSKNKYPSNGNSGLYWYIKR